MEKYLKYFSLQGTATRSEYWAVNLIGYFSLIVAAVIATVLIMSGFLGVLVGSLLMLVVSVSLVWSVITVTVRRCRDIGINPWFSLTLFIPYVALIPFIVFGCLKSEVKDDTSSN